MKEEEIKITLIQIAEIILTGEIEAASERFFEEEKKGIWVNDAQEIYFNNDDLFELFSVISGLVRFRHHSSQPSTLQDLRSILKVVKNT